VWGGRNPNKRDVNEKELGVQELVIIRSKGEGVGKKGRTKGSGCNGDPVQINSGSIAGRGEREKKKVKVSQKKKKKGVKGGIINTPLSPPSNENSKQGRRLGKDRHRGQEKGPWSKNQIVPGKD